MRSHRKVKCKCARSSNLRVLSAVKVEELEDRVNVRGLFGWCQDLTLAEDFNSIHRTESPLGLFCLYMAERYIELSPEMGSNGAKFLKGKVDEFRTAHDFANGQELTSWQRVTTTRFAFRAMACQIGEDILFESRRVNGVDIRVLGLSGTGSHEIVVDPDGRFWLLGREVNSLTFDHGITPVNTIGRLTKLNAEVANAAYGRIDRLHPHFLELEGIMREEDSLQLTAVTGGTVVGLERVSGNGRIWLSVNNCEQHIGEQWLVRPDGARLVEVRTSGTCAFFWPACNCH